MDFLYVVLTQIRPSEERVMKTTCYRLCGSVQNGTRAKRKTVTIKTGHRALILAALLTTGAYAFDDPTEFRGLKFGESVTTQLPHCPVPLTNTTEPCWNWDPGQGISSEVYRVARLKPIAGVALIVYVEEINKMPGRIEITFNSDGFSKVMDVFRERYGPPTDMQETKWTSKAGRTLPNTLITWRGENIHIQARHFSYKLDTSEIVITNKAYRDKKSQDNRDTIKDEAKGL
jgi:hypothetical protein